MRLLLDTHALLWWLFDAPELSRPARSALLSRTNEVWVSAAAGWEIAIKHNLGKLSEAAPIVADLPGAIERAGFLALPISLPHAAVAGRLPLHHRDPFDRILVAQAQQDGLTLISADRAFDPYGVRRLW